MDQRLLILTPNSVAGLGQFTARAGRQPTGATAAYQLDAMSARHYHARQCQRECHGRRRAAPTMKFICRRAPHQRWKIGRLLDDIQFITTYRFSVLADEAWPAPQRRHRRHCRRAKFSHGLLYFASASRTMARRRAHGAPQVAAKSAISLLLE